MNSNNLDQKRQQYHQLLYQERNRYFRDPRTTAGRIPRTRAGVDPCAIQRLNFSIRYFPELIFIIQLHWF